MRYIRNRKGQGTTEYIVILAIVVAIAITIVKTPLGDALTTKIRDIAKSITNVQTP